ncbi:MULTISPECIES: hypothetical protein [Anaeromyxobacter]|uniref:hypothetical protein n=1 Tax=Anaeromyxobacter TaxID=161492 RepID=UPI001F596482|nr:MULTISPECIES: hypothetical protein [unclassified Anaeromyxobacter]
MNTYAILMFLHVLAGVGVYVALGIETVALGGLRRAETPGEAGVWLRLHALPGRLLPGAMLVALASGAWMMATTWGHRPWILAAFIGMVGMGIAGGGVSGRAMRRLRAALATEDGAVLSPAFRAGQGSAALTGSLRVRIAIGLGILALMTLKPEAAGSALVLTASVVAGLAASLVHPGRSARLAGSGAG